jgi:hypothetical protein
MSDLQEFQKNMKFLQEWLKEMDRPLRWYEKVDWMGILLILTILLAITALIIL